MLLFQQNPDKIFSEILRLALEVAVDVVKFPREGTDDYDDEKNYEIVFPNASKIFSRKQTLKILENLQGYHEDSNLWKMTDYHMVVLYEALKNFCVPATEMAIDSGEAILTVGDYTVWGIDFDDLIECYFQDQDFLFDKDLFLDMTEEMKKKLEFRNETFGVLTKQPPHETEVVFKCHEEGEFIPTDPRPSMFTKESRVYPTVSEKED